MKNTTLKMLTLTAVGMSLVGCFQMSPNGFKEETSGGPGPTLCEDGSQPPCPGAVILGAKNLSIVGQTNLLEHNSSLAGSFGIDEKLIPMPLSADTRNKFTDKRNSLSLNGDTQSITAPMMFALTEIGAETCDDLLTEEFAKPIANRRFFQGTSFTGGSALALADVESASSKLARAFWQRSIDSTEKSTLAQDAMAAFPGTLSAAEARKAALFICTAQLVSFSALQL